MKGIIEQHVKQVPIAPGQREKYRTDILKGMMYTWVLVLDQAQQEHYKAGIQITSHEPTYIRVYEVRN